MRARNHNTLQTTSISITNTNTVCCFCYYCSDKCIEKHRRDETGKQICIFSIEQQSWPIHQFVWEQIHWHSWRSVNASFLHIHVSHTYTEARRSEQSATVDTLIFRWLAYTMGDALLLLHCCHCIMYIWPSSALCAYIYIYIKQRYGHDVKFILCKFAPLNVGAHSTRTDRIVVFAIKWSNM